MDCLVIQSLDHHCLAVVSLLMLPVALLLSSLRVYIDLNLTLSQLYQDEVSRKLDLSTFKHHLERNKLKSKSCPKPVLEIYYLNG